MLNHRNPGTPTLGLYGGRGPWRRAVSAALELFLRGRDQVAVIDETTSLLARSEVLISPDRDIVWYADAGMDPLSCVRLVRSLRSRERDPWEGGLLLVVASPDEEAQLRDVHLIPGVLAICEAPGIRIVVDPWSLPALLTALSDLDGFYQEQWLALADGLFSDITSHLARAEARLQLGEEPGAVEELKQAVACVNRIDWSTLVPHKQLSEVRAIQQNLVSEARAVGLATQVRQLLGLTGFDPARWRGGTIDERRSG